MIVHDTDAPAYLRMLREANKASSMSHSEIAVRAGVSKMTVYNVLSGSTGGTPDTIMRIAHAMLPTEPERVAQILSEHSKNRDSRLGRQATGDRAALAEAVNNLADAIRELARAT